MSDNKHDGEVITTTFILWWIHIELFNWLCPSPPGVLSILWFLGGLIAMYWLALKITEIRFAKPDSASSAASSDRKHRHLVEIIRRLSHPVSGYLAWRAKLVRDSASVVVTIVYFVCGIGLFYALRVCLPSKWAVIPSLANRGQVVLIIVCSAIAWWLVPLVLALLPLPGQRVVSKMAWLKSNNERRTGEKVGMVVMAFLLFRISQKLCPSLAPNREPELYAPFSFYADILLCGLIASFVVRKAWPGSR